MARFKTVDEYIQTLEGEKAEVVSLLRKVVKKAVPGVAESIKWSQPVFELNGPMCWIKAYTAHVTFGFWRGKELKLGRGLIESSGSRMGHLKVRSRMEVQAPLFTKLVSEAARLNRIHGNPTRG